MTAFGRRRPRAAAAPTARSSAACASAGAVILGITNVPELTILPFTETPTFGITRNPWDLQRTPGGSSGGSGAAVAAGLAPRPRRRTAAARSASPPACCGLVGLKPQRGPHPDGAGGRALARAVAWGAISARRRRQRAVLRRDQDAGRRSPRRPRATPGRLRIAVSVNTPPLTACRPTPSSCARRRGGRRALRSLGHDVIERDLDTAGARGTCSPRYLRGIPDDARAMPHPERLSSRDAADTRGSARRCRARCVARARRRRRRRRRASTRVFDDGVDAVLTPVFTRRPPRVGRVRRPPALWTLLGVGALRAVLRPLQPPRQPGESVPAGLTADGFPVGAQLVGAPRRRGDAALARRPDRGARSAGRTGARRSRA